MRMKLLAVPLCVVVIPPPATAAPQTVERAAAAEHATTVGVVSGRVVDAGSGAPLDLAVVTIAPIDGGILSAPGGRHGSFLADALVTTTGPMGEYRVEGLAPGRYRLTVERLGYRPARLEIELRSRGDSRVSVGLVIEPIALDALEIHADAPPTYGRVAAETEAAEQARVAAERLRQRRHLATDVRSITHTDVIEAVTLGETDLFRALHRLPGVSTQDDYTAELWIRGAPWDQTRVYFDGLPLFHPVHGVGVLSGISTDGIGAALLHPGVQPASLSGGAAALVIESRPGRRDHAHGLGDLSLASARLALDGPLPGGEGAWMIAARRSYLDWLTAVIARLLDNVELATPYAFSDVVARIDYRLDAERALEASGLWSSDRVTGDVPDLLHGNRARWGNVAARLTLHAPIAGRRARHSLGVSRYGILIRERTPDPILEDRFNAPQHPPADQSVVHLQAMGEVEAPDGAPRWSVGYGLVHERATYDGPMNPENSPGPYGEPRYLRLDGELTYGVFWGQRRWRPGERFSVETGLRLETGSALANAGPIRAAPRLSLRLEPRSDFLLSLGLGRHHQYAQSVGETGPWVTNGYSAGRLWVLAGDSVPVLTTDIVTLGAETWLPDGWLASANTYVRRSSGAAVPDPTPGLRIERPLFVEAEGIAYGIEIAARRLAGRWSLAGSYSFGVSELEAAGYRYPAPSERRHTVDLTAMARLGRSLRIGAAWTVMSGAPYTRETSDYIACSAEEPCTGTVVSILGDPGAFRTPTYRSLDLLVDWSRSFRSWGLGVYLQIRNALRHDNVAAYSHTSKNHCEHWGYVMVGDELKCLDEWGWYSDPVERDHFDPGLPILPLFGLRVTF